MHPYKVHFFFKKKLYTFNKICKMALPHNNGITIAVTSTLGDGSAAVATAMNAAIAALIAAHPVTVTLTGMSVQSYSDPATGLSKGTVLSCELQYVTTP
jgi:hypothetical protein